MILDSKGNPIQSRAYIEMTAEEINALNRRITAGLDADYANRFAGNFVTLYDADGRRIDTFTSKEKIGCTIRVQRPMRFRTSSSEGGDPE